MFRISRLFWPALAVLALLATACQPQVVTQTVQVEVTKEVPVEVTREVPVEVTAPPAAEAGTIRIGGVGPLSAPGDVGYGVAMNWAMNLAVKDINAKGGVLGKPLEMIFADTEGLPERGT